MSSSKLARLAEHSNIAPLRDDIHVIGSHGLLPSQCCKCKGFLDFVRINNRTVLKCRECKHIIELD